MAIGGCTIEELKARMTENEFNSWVAFYSQEPFGDRRLDINFTRLMQIQIAQAGKDVEFSKLMPEFWPEVLSPSDLAAKARIIFSQFI